MPKAPLKKVIRRRKEVDLEKANEFAAKAEQPEVVVTPPAEVNDAPKQGIIEESAPTEPQDIQRPESEPTVAAQPNLKGLFPWEYPEVKDAPVKGMGVPLSEEHMRKLRFIAENTLVSQRKFCQLRLQQAIDRQVKKILKKQADDIGLD